MTLLLIGYLGMVNGCEMRKAAYGAWKLHFAIVVLSMILGGIIATINVVVLGDMLWFWLIPSMPLIVYVTALALGFMVIFGGLGAAATLLWHMGRSVYQQVDQFFKDAETDKAFQWSEYFRIAGYMLLAWVVVMLAVFIIVSGVKDLSWW